jgi:hypothetical protein
MMIVAYLVERCEMSVEKALIDFVAARHPGIYKPEYIAELCARFVDPPHHIACGSCACVRTCVRTCVCVCACARATIVLSVCLQYRTSLVMLCPLSAHRFRAHMRASLRYDGEPEGLAPTVPPSWSVPDETVRLT